MRRWRRPGRRGITAVDAVASRCIPCLLPSLAVEPLSVRGWRYTLLSRVRPWEDLKADARVLDPVGRGLSDLVLPKFQGHTPHQVPARRGWVKTLLERHGCCSRQLPQPGSLHLQPWAALGIRSKQDRGILASEIKHTGKRTRDHARLACGKPGTMEQVVWDAAPTIMHKELATAHPPRQSVPRQNLLSLLMLMSTSWVVPRGKAWPGHFIEASLKRGSPVPGVQSKEF